MRVQLFAIFANFFVKGLKNPADLTSSKETQTSGFCFYSTTTTKLKEIQSKLSSFRTSKLNDALILPFVKGNKTTRSRFVKGNEIYWTLDTFSWVCIPIGLPYLSVDHSRFSLIKPEIDIENHRNRFQI